MLKFPNATLEYKGGDYVNKFVLPNVYFHITTAYGILRNLGVALGKTDYLAAAKDESATGSSMMVEGAEALLRPFCSIVVAPAIVMARAPLSRS